MTHSCKFQILIKLACFQYRNPNVSKVLHIHFVTFLTHGTNKKIKYQKTQNFIKVIDHKKKIHIEFHRLERVCYPSNQCIQIETKTHVFNRSPTFLMIYNNCITTTYHLSIFLDKLARQKMQPYKQRFNGVVGVLDTI